MFIYERHEIIKYIVEDVNVHAAQVQFHGHAMNSLHLFMYAPHWIWMYAYMFPLHIHSFHHIFIYKSVAIGCWQESHHNHSMGTNWNGSFSFPIRRSACVHTMWLWRSGYSQMQCFGNNDKFIPNLLFSSEQTTRKQAYLSASTWSLYRHDIILKWYQLNNKHSICMHLHNDRWKCIEFFELQRNNMHVCLSVCLPMSFALERRSSTRTIKYIFC